MGLCLSLPITWNDALSAVFNCLRGEASYVYKLEENLGALENGMEKLKDRRVSVEWRVDSGEDRGERRLPEVKTWLEKVRNIETEVEEQLADKEAELDKLCLRGYFSKDCKTTHDYGKEVSQKLEKVNELLDEEDGFTEVTGTPPPTPVVRKSIDETFGLEPMLENAWKHLMSDELKILGIYGMGGVGKTTLLTRINNKFYKEPNGFDSVILVEVGDQEIQSIQKEIGRRLRLCVKGWKKKKPEENARDICRALIKRKFALLLDDVREEVPLEKIIEVSKLDINNGCKVAFTTRNVEVCGSMKADHEIEVKCLAKDDAWNLFQTRIKENTLKKDPEIHKLARKVARTLQGLPLALNVIGETMSHNDEVPEWRAAVLHLTSADGKHKGMDEILGKLRYSYDNLKGDKYKKCFLYCALFPKDYEIHKMDLIGLWLGEGIIHGNGDWDRVVCEGYEIIGTLIRACLLTGDERGDHVKMHGLLHEMALRIASDSMAKTSAQLPEVPNLEDWKDVTKMSLINNEIQGISDSPNCPNLLTLFLKHNLLKKVSGEFFSSMPKLMVLDLSWNFFLKELPEEISKLESLQYLSLYRTGIERLPDGLKELRRLIYLDLSNTNIQSIDGVSCLSKLQALGLYRCYALSLNLEELERLEHLKYLSITLRDFFELGNLNLMSKIGSVTRKVCVFTLGLSLNSLRTQDGLEELELKTCKIEDSSTDWGRNMYFRNLSVVSISQCSVQDLTWLLYAPVLADLCVMHVPKFEEMITREEVPDAIVPFQRLKFLTLANLDELKSIYWSPLPFPCLVYVKIWQCPKLKKLPLNSESAKGRDISMHVDKEWMEAVEWEDEAAKERFSQALIEENFLYHPSFPIDFCF